MRNKISNVDIRKQMKNKFHSGPCIHRTNSWKRRMLEFSETWMCLCREMFLRILRVILIFVHRHALVIHTRYVTHCGY